MPADDSCRITLHFIMFGRYSIFLQIEGLWPPCIEQIYQHRFPNSIIIFLIRIYLAALGLSYGM